MTLYYSYFKPAFNVGIKPVESVSDQWLALAGFPLLLERTAWLKYIDPRARDIPKINRCLEDLECLQLLEKLAPEWSKFSERQDGFKEKIVTFNIGN
ncbi:MAG: hypothetical protein LBT35_00230, partial [Tannerella sp.]|nr:hypothetical protein [Tannerella sp.]